MSRKKVISKKKILYAFKIGAAAFGISMMLLLPAAAFVYTGKVDMAHQELIVWINTAAGVMLSHVLYGVKQQGREGVIMMMGAEIFFLCFVVFLSAGLPGGQMEWKNMYPIMLSSVLGNIAGILINFNKMYKRKRSKRRRYT